MRTKPFLTITSMIALIFAGAIVFTNNCSKEGPVGPAGKDANEVSAADKAAYDAADGKIGGRAYDHIISEYGITDAAIKNHPNFFRCKCCHGWDLRGRNGVLIDHPSDNTYPVATDDDLYIYAKSHNIRQIFDAVKNPGGRYKTASVKTSYNGAMPSYESLTDTQIWQLVKFLKIEAHNVFDFYDFSTSGTYPTGTLTFSNIGKGGDPVAGRATYNATCVGCHGADGKSILIYCGDEYMGDMFRNGPEEVQHKAKFGMPKDIDHTTCQYYNQGMPVFSTITDQDIRNMLVMGQDAVAFPGFSTGTKKMLEHSSRFGE